MIPTYEYYGNFISFKTRTDTPVSHLNLEGIEEMIKMDQLSNLSGSVGIRGRMYGSVNQESGNFINDEGSLTASLDDVSFVLMRDSIHKDSIQHITGEFILQDTIIEARDLRLEFNGNPFHIGVSTENLLLYLLDYDRDLSASLGISSERINTASLLGEAMRRIHTGLSVGAMFR